MEKTRDVPGWYKRLISYRTKPASELNFKQYCQENEPRLKVLYPFLPHEQIKGKLFARWRRHQPPEAKVTVKVGVKKLKKHPKQPVAFFTAKQDTDGGDWLIGDKQQTGRTFKGRAFNLPARVPKVISESSFTEKGILKNATRLTEKEKRLSLTNVSFATNEQGALSPVVYSPPTPFNLSDDDFDVTPMQYNMPDCTEKPPSQTLSKSKGSTSKSTEQFQNPKQTSTPKITAVEQTNKKMSLSVFATSDEEFEEDAFEFKKPTPVEHPVAKTRLASGRKAEQFPQPKQAPKPRQTTPKSLSSASKQNTSQSSEKISCSQSKKSPKNISTRKSQRNRDLSAETPNSTVSLSQFLEPPKFGPPVSETPEQPQKRFCLFEDEWVKPKLPPKTKNTKKTSGITKPDRFSWSPTIGCSQQTPKLKKPKHTFCSQDVEETYTHVPKTARADKTAKQPEFENQTTANKHDDAVISEEDDVLFLAVNEENDDRYSGKENQGLTKGETQKNKNALKPLQSHVNSQFVDTRHNTAIGTASFGNTRITSLRHKTADNKKIHKKESPALHTRSKEKSPADNTRGKQKTLRKDSGDANSLKLQAKLAQPKTKSKTTRQTHAFETEIKTRHQDKAFEYDSDSLPSQPLRNKPPAPKHQALESDPESDIEAAQKEHTLDSDAEIQAGPKEQAEYSDSDRHPDPKKHALESDAESDRLSASWVPADPTPRDSDDELLKSPDMTEGTNVLWSILFQLRNTAASSHGHSIATSSPAQSRFSELSARSPSTCAPSPKQNDLMDDLGPAVAEEFPLPTKNKTAMAGASRPFRKRGNTLCNMFDDSASASTVSGPPKVKRFLRSETYPEKDDFSNLFNADTFI